MRRAIGLLIVVLALCSCSSQQPHNGSLGSDSGHSLAQQKIGDLTATISAPSTTPTGLNGLLVSLTGPDGAPLSNAQVSAKTSMPEHAMSGPEMLGKQRVPGQYWLSGNLMKGDWRIDLSVKERSGKTAQGAVNIAVP